MNLVLTGMRGSGKSKLGRLLAEKLGKKFIDLDEYIEELVNKKITQIVTEDGWEKFRELENQATKEVSKLDETVIATGGGTLMDPENAKLLKDHGFIIFLEVDLDVLEARISGASTRPALTSKTTLKEELQAIWEERKEIYRKHTNLTYNSSHNIDPSLKVDELIALIPSCR